MHLCGELQNSQNIEHIEQSITGFMRAINIKLHRKRIYNDQRYVMMYPYIMTKLIKLRKRRGIIEK